MVHIQEKKPQLNQDTSVSVFSSLMHQKLFMKKCSNKEFIRSTVSKAPLN